MYENVKICHDRLLPRDEALMRPQETVSVGTGASLAASASMNRINRTAGACVTAGSNRLASPTSQRRCGRTTWRERRASPKLSPPVRASGARSGGFTAITEGLKEGEEVVVEAAFLIDAESNLNAALAALAAPEAEQ